MIIIAVHVGDGMFSSGRYLAVWIFLQIGFWERSIKLPNRRTSEKKWCTLYCVARVEIRVYY